MHHIARVVIHNFRACRDVDLTLAPVTPIVGQNNAGKSTILDAIQWAIAPTKLEASQFGNPAQVLQVAFEVHGLDARHLDRLDARHRRDIAPYVSDDGRLWLRRRMEGPGTATRAILEVCQPTPGASITDADAEWRPNPTGIANAIAALFPEPIRIAAMQDAAADAGTAKKSNTLGKLLARLVDDDKLDPDAKLSTALGVLYDALGGDGGERARALTELDASIQDLVVPVFPGIELTTTLPRPSLADLLSNATVRVKTHEGSEPVEFGALGHGTQRTIHVAMIRLLARQATAEPASTTLLLFDEPELYLHPRGIAQVRAALRDLAEHGYQVAFTTHAPAMLEPATAANTIVASRPSGSSGTRLRLPVREAVLRVGIDEAKHVETVFELANAAEVFFSDRVLVVEGGSDAAALRTALALLEARDGHDGVLGLVEAYSSRTIPKLRRVLSAMDLPTATIGDLDAAWQVYQPELRRLGHERLLADLVNAFKDLERRGLAYLGDGAAPSRKKGDPNLTAEAAWTSLATDAAYADLVASLHHALRPLGIYLWPCGTLEAACGITQKGEAATRAFANELASLDLDIARSRHPLLIAAAEFARCDQPSGSEVITWGTTTRNLGRSSISVVPGRRKASLREPAPSRSPTSSPTTRPASMSASTRLGSRSRHGLFDHLRTRHDAAGHVHTAHRRGTADPLGPWNLSIRFQPQRPVRRAWRTTVASTTVQPSWSYRAPRPHGRRPMPLAGSAERWLNSAYTGVVPMRADVAISLSTCL